PRKAAAVAEELFADDPQNVWALTIKMLQSLEDQNTEQAKAYARQIQSLAQEQSHPYQIAAKILAVDPNAPGEYKGPVEKK
ncbi:MAG: hypothetical protein ACM3VT_01265, partial [Solirubrobacterales bacterium]